MKKILFVEDDALVARIYSQKLAAEGFEVDIAEDGLVAVKRLREFRPDLVVLDLLMPKLSGVDVLKFLRQSPDLKDIRIVVFSNSFLSSLVEEVAQIGVEEALVKAAVTPARLVEVIRRILASAAGTFLSPKGLAARLADPGRSAPAEAAGAKPVSETSPPAAVSEDDPIFRVRVQKEFLERAPVIFKNLRQLCMEFVEASDSPIGPRKLEELRRKIGFLVQMMGMAGRHQLAQLASALEALLFELQDKPADITDSCRHTIASTVVFLAERLEYAPAEDKQNLPPPTVLVVDDDAVTSRAVAHTLGRANLSVASISDPFDALKRLEETPCDLVLLDINMPGMDGISLCERMRGLPLHKRTPVIFFTGRTDFKTRIRTVLSGGNDLITKPILPTELCVKTITLMLKNRLAEPAPAR
jgi:CheY-like chemotaxis protein